MIRNYTDLNQDILKYVAKLRNELPEVMQEFGELAISATRKGVVDAKSKELIAMSIAIALGCEGCIGYHAEALVKLGASREELIEILGMTIYMGGGPSIMYAAEALKAYEEFSNQK